MTFGLPTESAKGIAELDPVAEFRQGVSLLKNGYPERGPRVFAARIRERTAQPLLPLVSRVVDWACRAEVESSIGDVRNSGTVKTRRDPVPS